MYRFSRNVKGVWQNVMKTKNDKGQVFGTDCNAVRPYLVFPERIFPINISKR